MNKALKFLILTITFSYSAGFAKISAHDGFVYHQYELVSEQDPRIRIEYKTIEVRDPEKFESALAVVESDIKTTVNYRSNDDLIMHVIEGEGNLQKQEQTHSDALRANNFFKDKFKIQFNKIEKSVYEKLKIVTDAQIYQAVHRKAVQAEDFVNQKLYQYYQNNPNTYHKTFSWIKFVGVGGGMLVSLGLSSDKAPLLNYFNGFIAFAVAGSMSKWTYDNNHKLMTWTNKASNLKWLTKVSSLSKVNSIKNRTNEIDLKWNQFQTTLHGKKLNSFIKYVVIESAYLASIGGVLLFTGLDPGFVVWKFIGSILGSAIIGTFAQGQFDSAYELEYKRRIFEGMTEGEAKFLWNKKTLAISILSTGLVIARSIGVPSEYFLAILGVMGYRKYSLEAVESKKREGFKDLKSGVQDLHKSANLLKTSNQTLMCSRLFAH